MSTAQTANPSEITVPTASGLVTVKVPPMVATLDWGSILAIQAATNAAYVAKKNAELQMLADQKGEAYNTMMGSGSFTDPPKPVFPPSYRFVAADSETGMPTWTQDGPPILPSFPLATSNNANIAPPVPVEGLPALNWKSRPAGPSHGSFVTAFKTDGIADGQVIGPLIDPTHPSDPPHKYQRSGAPVGPGWYQQVD